MGSGREKGEVGIQALCQWRIEKRAGDEWGLVGKKERSGGPVSIVLKTLFRYTSSWYTSVLVTRLGLIELLQC